MPLLFSYGTLQQEDVQFATFDRPLAGQPDELLGFVSTFAEIEDAKVVTTSGLRHHPTVKFTGATQDRVPGSVFERADQYEVSAYQRVRATLACGQRAWVYVDARIDSD